MSHQPRLQVSRATSATSITIRRAKETDLDEIATIGSEAFSGLRPQRSGRSWIQACWRASPRMSYWVAIEKGAVVGYILWLEKGGFRQEAVLELEQIAVQSRKRDEGIGASLVTQSLQGMTEELRKRGSRLRLVEVTTGVGNRAAEFYKRVLGAEVKAQLPDVFHGDELILIARFSDQRP